MITAPSFELDFGVSVGQPLQSIPVIPIRCPRPLASNQKQRGFGGMGCFVGWLAASRKAEECVVSAPSNEQPNRQNRQTGERHTCVRVRMRPRGCVPAHV
ncbi:hypothetical protein amb3642 [Paramagnetospirillum magneticum AMB-1]|uniref:Uncharacterized protein n=1 Tax=Paramagnetospirillum magneticum (strain ATCC 700264 / AMB-1) TaxID=342108 RepID=Q2W129_PARM1|nr:hypothetical protein amb3642 [Paramagnetospirillum magneticum AMB-1]